MMSKWEERTPEECVESVVLDLNSYWSMMQKHRSEGLQDGYPSDIGMDFCKRYRHIILTIGSLGGKTTRYSDGSHEVSVFGITVHSLKGVF
jgi:hypothetical protein|nr:MAG TPA: hypothetical protein [Caudoviricetes sp.]DAI70812.1 MAG TPA: hypothetical protein [Bacteriophage sp.]